MTAESVASPAPASAAEYIDTATAAFRASEQEADAAISAATTGARQASRASSQSATHTGSLSRQALTSS